MSMSFVFLIAALCLAAVLFWAPLLKPKTQTLPILLIGKTGTPPHNSHDKKQWLCLAKLEKLLARLNARGFTAILPQDIAKNALPARPVILLFYGGYQSVYSQAFALLEKYACKACAALPAGLIGQYDAWQNPRQGPWQNLLTAPQIQQLQKSKRIEFISTTLDGTSASGEADEKECWKLPENKTRLQYLYNLKTNAVYFPPPDPLRPAVLQTARQHFALLIGNQKGNNPLPLNTTDPLRVLPIQNGTCLLRLFWKMERN